MLPPDGDRDSSAPRAGAGVPPCPTAIRQLLAPTLGQKSRPQAALDAAGADKPQVVHLPDLENADRRVSDTPSLSSTSSSKGRASEHSSRSSNCGSFDVLRFVEHATPLFSGILLALHGAIGARLGATYDSPFFACMMNMTVALGLLLLFAYITPFFCKSVADGSAVAAMSEAVAVVSRVVSSRTTSKNDTVGDLGEDELRVQEAGADGSSEMTLAGGHQAVALDAVEEEVERMKAKQDEQILDANQLSCSTTASVPPSLFNITADADAPASTSSGVLASPDSCKGQTITKTKAAQEQGEGSPAPADTPSPLKSLLRTRLNRLFASTTTSSASSLSAPGTLSLSRHENGSSGNLSSGSNVSAGEEGLFEDSSLRPAFPKMASLEEIDLRCEGDADARASGERDLNILPNGNDHPSSAAADPNLSPKNGAPSQAGSQAQHHHYEPVRLWKLSGGFFGTFIVTSSFLAIARLGTVTFFLINAAGQLSASMLCDNFGFAGLSKRPVTSGKAAAVFLVACGATLVITNSTLEGGGSSGSSSPADLPFFQRLGFMFLAFCAGASLPVQASINSAARRCFRTVFSGALVSFTGASFASTLLFFSIDYPLPPAKSDVQWWMFGTGFIGAFCVFSGMVIGPRIGQTMMWLLILLGQSVGAIPFDHFGLLGLPQRRLTALRLVGLLIVGTGVVLNMRYNLKQMRSGTVVASPRKERAGTPG